MRTACRNLRTFLAIMLTAGATACVTSEKSSYMRHLSVVVPQRHAGEPPAHEPIALGARSDVHVDASD
jgi:hypothetical protein